jgi:hypothetical protein
MEMRITGRPLAALAVAAALVASALPAHADAAACQAVIAAVIKQADVPVRQKITIESAAAPGKPIQSEVIHVGDTLYMQVRGQWTARPYDRRKVTEDTRQAMLKAEHSCTRLRSEAVDGQAAELYSVQSKSVTGNTDSQIWLSSATGLPLRQHTVVLDQGTTKMQHDVRFDYANVQAPPGVAR